MKSLNERRIFLKKLGLFSTLCLTGINESLGKVNAESSSNGLILKAEEGEVRYIGNNRKAKVIIKIAKTPDHIPEMSLLSEIITPGDGIPVHKHLHEEEFLFVQRGKVEITLGDEVEEGGSGDLIYVPKGTWHGFFNKSKEDVIMLFGYSPPGFENYFRTIGTKDLNEKLMLTAEDWIQINNKYGVVYKS